MKSISIDSEKYVKATDIARELGYTADYVGQLCRARKVDSQLVGRSWYVSEDSIRSYKKTRYRSTKKASTEAVAQSLEAEGLDSKESFEVPSIAPKNSNQTRYAGQHFYSHTPPTHHSNYFTDETGLIPEGMAKNKTGHLAVSLAGTQTVKIKSHSEEFDNNPTQHKGPRFAGVLKVHDAENEGSLHDEHTQMRPKDTVVHTEINTSIPKKHYPATFKDPNTSRVASTVKVQHLRKSTKMINPTPSTKYKRTGVPRMKRDRITKRKSLDGTLTIETPLKNSSVSGSGVYFILISVVISLVISTFLLGMQAFLQTEGSTAVNSFIFDFDTVLSAIYTAW